MFSVKVEGYFSSAHNLRGYRGKCEELHGHNWKVELAVTRKNLDEAGMVLDFKYLKEQLNRVLDGLDHKYLNNLQYFKKVNPTSERIAEYIFGRLKPQVRGLKSVTVWESENSAATFSQA